MHVFVLNWEAFLSTAYKLENHALGKVSIALNESKRKFFKTLFQNKLVDTLGDGEGRTN